MQNKVDKHAAVNLLRDKSHTFSSAAVHASSKSLALFKLTCRPSRAGALESFLSAAASTTTKPSMTDCSEQFSGHSRKFVLRLAWTSLCGSSAQLKISRGRTRGGSASSKTCQFLTRDIGASDLMDFCISLLPRYDEPKDEPDRGPLKGY